MELLKLEVVAVEELMFPQLQVIIQEAMVVAD
jgi:hypothetical protein